MGNSNRYNIRMACHFNSVRDQKRVEQMIGFIGGIIIVGIVMIIFELTE